MEEGSLTDNMPRHSQAGHTNMQELLSPRICPYVIHIHEQCKVINISVSLALICQQGVASST